MKQLTKNVYVDIERRGSNHGYVTTSDGIALIDTPHKPSGALRLKAEIATRGPLRYVGDHAFRLVHMPGHTDAQAAIIVQEEGVVFTSDNVFCRVHTWLQEADPDRWLEALNSLRALREDTFVPGHGPICDKRYLDEQGAFIREWVDYVRRHAVERGLSKEQAVAELAAMTDRYPMDVEQDGMAPMVMRMNVANLYDFATGAGIHQRAPAR